MPTFNFLEKTEPTYFPYHVVKSDDGGGNLVAYNSGSPTSGWTAPMATPFSGLWLRVEFTDYYVNFKHNGSTWVVYNEEKKIQLYGTTEFNTGLTDDNGDIIYGKTFNITGANTTFIVGLGTAYITDIPRLSVNQIIDFNIYSFQISGTRNYYSTTGAVVDKNTLQTNLIIYSLSSNVDTSYKITIYYTKN